MKHGTWSAPVRILDALVAGAAAGALIAQTAQQSGAAALGPLALLFA